MHLFGCPPLSRACSCTRLILDDNWLDPLPPALARATRLATLSLRQNPVLRFDSEAVRLLAALPALEDVTLPAQVPARLVNRLAASTQSPALQLVLPQ